MNPSKTFKKIKANPLGGISLYLKIGEQEAEAHILIDDEADLPKNNSQLAGFITILTGALSSRIFSLLMDEHEPHPSKSKIIH